MSIAKACGCVFSVYITRKNGYRDYAWKHGFRAWPIMVCDKHAR